MVLVALSEPGTAAVPVHCRVELPAPWLEGSGARLGESAGRIVEGLAPLFESLGLPVAPVIEFAPCAAGGSAWGLVAPVMVGGKCVFARLPRQDAPVSELEAALVQALWAAPDFFVTPDVVAAVAVGSRVARRSQQSAWLSELARRGLSLRRVRHAPAPEGSAARPHDGAAPEEWGAGQGDCVIRVHRRDPNRELGSAVDADPFPKLLELMRDGLFYELGLLVPGVEFVADRHLRPHEFRIQVNDVPLPTGQGLREIQMLVNDTPDRLRAIGVEGRAATNPANDHACTIAEASAGNIAACQEAGLTVWGPAGYLVLSLAAAIRKDAGSLISVQGAEAGLFLLAKAFPDLVAAARARIPMARLTQVLRHLLDEEVCIRDLRAILEALLALEGTTSHDQHDRIVFLPSAGGVVPWPERRPIEQLEPFVLGDAVRIALKRAISHQYAGGTSELVAYLLDPKVEAALEAQAPLEAEPEQQLRLFAAIWSRIGVPPAGSRPPVILTTFRLRSRLRQWLARAFPGVAVLAYEELAPDLSIQPAGRITLD